MFWRGFENGVRKTMGIIMCILYLDTNCGFGVRNHCERLAIRVAISITVCCNCLIAKTIT